MLRFLLIFVVLLLGNAGVGHSQWVRLPTTILGSGLKIGAYNCFFFNKDSGFVSTAKGLAVTTDGCVTWIVDSTAPGSGWQFDEGQTVSFPLFNDGWIGFGDQFHKTTDHGIHWEPDSNTVLDSLGLYTGEGGSMYFQDSMNGWEGAGFLSILRTIDGGRSWHLQHKETDSSRNLGTVVVRQIQFCKSNGNLGMALAGDGEETFLLRTMDAGSTWKNTSSDYFHPLSDAIGSGISYPDPNHIWVIFYNGDDPIESLDTGSTWQSVSVSSNMDQFTSVNFVDSNHGLLTATSGAAAYTMDGGNTWHRDSLGDFYLVSGSLPDTNVAYVIGPYSIFRLSFSDLAVQPSPQDSTSAFVESEAGNLFLVMPQNVGGRLRIVDALGRVLQDEMLLPGARTEIGNGAQAMPQFRFAEVECNGRVQVFKVLQ